ncbi:hypothetical protein EMPG_11419 [Blastomyces silverae]|uniref:Uncharacterized protein n=1 Tax=Blastomyces silverae TaxID=2060906 RepID=A0A0H1BX61_9EURO|nr:hypothetical protein EMPG_11419 [Blastomyces silverae]
MDPANRRHPQITWQLRLRRIFYRYIYRLETPLELRGTLIRLRHRNKAHPYLALLRLFLPLPTWHFRLPDPIPFKTMLNNPALLDSHLFSADITNMRSIPLWRARDTPLRSLYRIYEALAAREYVVIGPEVEYFFYQNRRSWAVCRIPDPGDGHLDVIRYALLACIAEELAKAFNWRMSYGMRRDKRKQIHRKSVGEVLPAFEPETVPAWATKVPPIDTEGIADLPGVELDSSGKLVLEAGGRSPTFMKRNIVTDSGYFYTI